MNIEINIAELIINSNVLEVLLLVPAVVVVFRVRVSRASKGGRRGRK